jgi:peptidoglycan/LPS O-acetylase OafA/YrhL
MDKRYKELDSLRGIAAIFVFLFHIVMVLPDHWREGLLWKVLNLSPFHLLFTGKIHVIFFFVLSGFVLSLPFLSTRTTLYRVFMIKRFCRLYIPYVFAISIAIVLSLLFSKGGGDGLSSWFNTLWVDKIDKDLVISHYLFLGSYNFYAINIVIWTLIHEMRISFIFPLLMILAIHFNWKINLLIGLGMAVLGGILHFIIQDQYQAVYKTFPYILMFITGILLSKHRHQLIEKYNSFNASIKITWLVLGLILYTYSDFLGNPLLIDWVTTLGVSILLIISISSNTLSKFLLQKPFTYLGKISYSLYLYHLPILLSLLNLFSDKWPVWLVIVLAIVATLVFSSFAWYVIEHPSMKLAKYFSRKITFKHQLIVKEKKYS